MLVQRHQGLVFAVCRSVLGAAIEAEDAARAVPATALRQTCGPTHGAVWEPRLGETPLDGKPAPNQG